MAGMGIGAAAGAQPQDDPTQPPPETGQEQPQGAEPNVTPEEQAQYDEFVTNAMKLIYQGKEVTPAVLEQLRGKWKDVEPSLGKMPEEERPLDPKEPIDNIAVAAAAVILSLEASAASMNKRVDPVVLFHGGAEILEQLADIAKAASIHDFTTDEMSGAANRLAMVYGVSSKTANKQEALDEFNHFLKTEGENLGASLGQVSQQERGGPAGAPDQPEQGA